MSDLATSLMERIIAKMTVISEQRARAYDGVTVHGGEKHDGLAPLAEKPMVDYWLDRFNRAESPHSRRLIVLEAKQALEEARVTPVPKGQPPVFGDAQWKRYIGANTESTKTLASRFNCTPQYINLVRRQYRKKDAA